MSSAADAASNFPTMIIPKGTDIRINEKGQLSIRTPGNLVIQNSGNYSELESTNGSIRIEENVHVEAVTVRAAQVCYVQGTLTAWRVKAKKISLEERAKAYIMLQEAEQLDLAKTSRLVGNFGNEKEIYLMLGKFTPQLKELPASLDMQSDPSLPEAVTVQPEQLPESVQQALMILEKEVRRPDLDPASSEALREVVFAIRDRNLSRVSAIYQQAFSELASPSDSLKRAYDLLHGTFVKAQ